MMVNLFLKLFMPLFQFIFFNMSQKINVLKYIYKILHGLHFSL